MKPKILDAVLALDPNCTCSVSGGVLTRDNEAKITQTQIDAKLAELETEYDAQEYARNRQAEYPDWGTQLEKIADDGIDAWKTDMLEPVKAKYPKP